MDSLEHKPIVERIAGAEACIRPVTEALLNGAAIVPVEMLRVLGAVRHLKAEIETLEQVLNNMGQKKP